jgi:hypothetical protein
MTEPVLPVEPVGRAVGATATLSFVGGFVDVVGFIALFGLFTAHVTGNFIMLGLEMVHADPDDPDSMVKDVKIDDTINAARAIPACEEAVSDGSMLASGSNDDTVKLWDMGGAKAAAR